MAGRNNSTSKTAENPTGAAGWDGSLVGMNRNIITPSIAGVNDQYDWSVPQLADQSYRVKGIDDMSQSLYSVHWTDLVRLQQQVGGEKLVSWIGITCSLQEMNQVKGMLEVKIDELSLPLQVMTIYDLGQQLIGDFDRFEKMAAYYTPVMLFVAVLIVMVNAVALTMARRKELALLRIVGFSLNQIQMMFIVECIVTAVCGGLIGSGVAALIAFTLAKDAAISWLPFFISLLATTIVSTVITLILTKGKFVFNIKKSGCMNLVVGIQRNND
ncbi:MAG: hypothetical protein LLG09_03840 [Negativicutes bacterium]|nr:hypothetical protein [Negativicutes bacterium]